MHEQVCYLVRPHNGEGLTFATEADAEPCAASGAFFLLGRNRERLLREYEFHAIHSDRIVATRMIRHEASRAFYRVDVDAIGTFWFHATSIRRKPKYVGREVGFQGLSAVRRVCPLRPLDLDVACRHHKFYFVGYSPRIGGEQRG